MTVERTPTDYEALASLAASTEALTVLEARRTELPERKEVERLTRELDQLHREATLHRVRQREEKQDIQRLRQDIAKLTERKKADVEALSAETDRTQRELWRRDLAGTETRLTDLQQRLEHLERTRSFFEADAEAEGSPLDAELTSARQLLERAENALQADIDAASARIARARAWLSPAIARAYDDQLRDHGVGAAPLKGRTCQGCYMELDPASLKAIRAQAARAGNTAPTTQEQAQQPRGPQLEIPRCPECNVFLIVETGTEA